jgi:hypothetical protein
MLCGSRKRANDIEYNKNLESLQPFQEKPLCQKGIEEPIENLKGKAWKPFICHRART